MKLNGNKVLQLLATVDVATYYVSEQIRLSLQGQCEIETAFLTGKLPEEHHTNNTVKYFNFTKECLKGLSRWGVIRSLFQYVKANKFGLIIAHRFKSIHLMMVVCWLLRIPMVGVVHGMGDYDRKYRQRHIKIFITKQSVFVAVSDEVKQYLLGLSCGFTDENTRVISNAVNLEKVLELSLSKPVARQSLDLPKEAFVFGTVARLVPIKGHRYLIEAISKLSVTHPQMQVVIIGDGRSRADLQNLANELNIADKIVFAGWKAKASQYVTAFDVFVMPSLSEGMPLAMLEAMSLKVPIIGSKIPALRSVIEGAEGSCFEPEDSTGLALVLESYLKMSNEQLGSLGESAFKYVKKQHSIQAFQKKYQQFILPRISKVDRFI